MAIASVTLRDLADDLAYWRSQLEVDNPTIPHVIHGIRALEDVLRGYNDGGFTIGSDHADS